MKQWVKKLIDGFEVSKEETTGKRNSTLKLAAQGQSVTRAPSDLSEDRATLLYLLDVYNKHLFEVEKTPLRIVREKLDGFSKALIHAQQPEEIEKTLFELRQFFASYRLDENTYVQSTFEDFKKIIWEFADQLGEDQIYDKKQDQALALKLKDLREAVEANSIDQLRAQAKSFINTYVTLQTHKLETKEKRLGKVRKNLNTMKKKLLTTQKELTTDHLTGSYNRKFFEEMAKTFFDYYQVNRTSVSMILVDIDFFKKINDSYGHDIGDFVLKECASLLRKIFSREDDVVARIGGEEFVILLPMFDSNSALIKAEEAMVQIRKEVFVHGPLEIKFTVSMGISQLTDGEGVSEWFKRADQALYESKKTGRNKATVSVVSSGKKDSVVA